MPRMDGTGPVGQGPLTGWGFGPCGRMARGGYGRGFRQGYGRGFGFGYRGSYPLEYGTDIEPMSRKDLLENERKAIKAELEAIDRELEDLE